MYTCLRDFGCPFGRSEPREDQISACICCGAPTREQVDSDKVGGRLYEPDGFAVSDSDIAVRELFERDRPAVCL